MSLPDKRPLTALAPMQDVTDLAFMRIVARYGAPDLYFTEFFRVHAQSKPERHILRSIDENDTGRPVFAQIIGEDPEHIIRTVEELLPHPVAGIDLNLGCPAPKVYRKNVGGGLLREPDKIGLILERMRAAVPTLLTVKMRIGFDDPLPLDRIVDLVNLHRIDLLSVHGRTVKQGYRGEVRYDLIARAAARAACPVLANGNLTSAERALKIVSDSGAAGAMLGRHAIRFPWVFGHIRARAEGGEPPPVRLAQAREYIELLYEATGADGAPEVARVARMKKYLNFVGQGVDPEGVFLHEMRRASTAAQLFGICDRHLLGEPDRPFPEEPYPGLVARPNCEEPAEPCGA